MSTSQINEITINTIYPLYYIIGFAFYYNQSSTILVVIGGKGTDRFPKVEPPYLRTLHNLMREV